MLPWRLGYFSFYWTIASLLLLPCANLFGEPSQSIVGYVVSTSGQVRANKRNLKPGIEIYLGDTIRTTATSTAKILMNDGSIVDLQNSSVFSVRHFRLNNMSDREVTLDVELGKVRSSIRRKLDQKGKFFIRTRSSVLAVRGTEVLVSVSENNQSYNQQITVAEGQVSIQPLAGVAGVTTVLNAGEQLNHVYEVQGNNLSFDSRKAENVTVTQLAPSSVKEAVSETKVEDKSFEQTISIEGVRTMEIANRTLASENEAETTSDIEEKEVFEAAVPKNTGVDSQVRLNRSDSSVGNVEGGGSSSIGESFDDIGGYGGHLPNLGHVQVEVIFKP